MITISFKRFGNGIYISHTDVLRSLNRTMRRAGIGVNYSKGFNRHMALKLSQPLPLGIASDDEWVTADIAERIDKEEFFLKFRDNCPPFIAPNSVYETEKNPSIASKVTASSYEIVCPNAKLLKEEIENLKNGLTIVVEKNGEKTEKNFTDLIYDIQVRNGIINCVFGFGNKNLRTDVFCAYLKEHYGLDIPLTAIVRKEQLIKTEDSFIPVSKYMETLI